MVRFSGIAIQVYPVNLKRDVPGLKKVLTGGLILVVALAAGLLIWIPHWVDPAPEGEGSYRDRARMNRVFDLLERTDQPFDWMPGYSEHLVFQNGNEAVVLMTDSHATPKGGTIGIWTEDGQRFFFRGHVCGPYGVTLEGETVAELISSLETKGGMKRFERQK